VLERIGAAPLIRLACQLRPAGDLVVAPLLVPGISAREALALGGARHGIEQEIAVMFCDLRAFTQMADQVVAGLLAQATQPAAFADRAKKK